MHGPARILTAARPVTRDQAPSSDAAVARRPGARGQLRGPEQYWAAGVGTAGQWSNAVDRVVAKFQVRARLGSRSATAAKGQGSVTRPGVKRAAGGGTAGSVEHSRPPRGSGRCRGRINEPSPGTASQPPQPWCHGSGRAGRHDDIKVNGGHRLVQVTKR